jgi:DNA polymerase V
MKNVFALVDCNNFYVSCERVFKPALEGKPIVVLSNNDGCIVSRSDEAKQLNIPMGAPYYQWREVIKENQVQVLSSNYELYGDMSHRVMVILEKFCPEIEIYSIDEAFLSLQQFSIKDLISYGLEIKQAIKMWTGLPVAIGFAATKTLAKIANHIAKKYSATGVYHLFDPLLNEKIMNEFPICEIWGIGKKLTKRLSQLNIYTAKDLRDSDLQLLRREFSIVMERIAQELRGICCLSLEAVQPFKQIISSRSFGKIVTEIGDIEEALSHYVARACIRLRKQKSRAGGMNIFLKTNVFQMNKDQYCNAMTIKFIQPTNSTSEIICLAKQMLNKLFRKGYRYHKVGLILIDLVPETMDQLDLFTGSCVQPKKDSLMKTVDVINKKLGKETLQFCAEGIKKTWKIKCDKRSGRYTTRSEELVQAQCR